MGKVVAKGGEFMSPSIKVFHASWFFTNREVTKKWAGTIIEKDMYEGRLKVIIIM